MSIPFYSNMAWTKIAALMQNKSMQNTTIVSNTIHALISIRCRTANPHKSVNYVIIVNRREENAIII